MLSEEEKRSKSSPTSPCQAPFCRPDHLASGGGCGCGGHLGKAGSSSHQGAAELLVRRFGAAFGGTVCRGIAGSRGPFYRIPR